MIINVKLIVLSLVKLKDTAEPSAPLIKISECMYVFLCMSSNLGNQFMFFKLVLYNDSSPGKKTVQKYY